MSEVYSTRSVYWCQKRVTRRYSEIIQQRVGPYFIRIKNNNNKRKPCNSLTRHQCRCVIIITTQSSSIGRTCKLDCRNILLVYAIKLLVHENNPINNRFTNIGPILRTDTGTHKGPKGPTQCGWILGPRRPKLSISVGFTFVSLVNLVSVKNITDRNISEWRF